MKRPIKLRYSNGSVNSGSPFIGIAARRVGRLIRPMSEYVILCEAARFKWEPRFQEAAGLVLWGNQASFQDLCPSSISRKIVLFPDDLEDIKEGDVIFGNPSTGVVNSLIRQDSSDNVLLVTEECNSNCTMCSQPPRIREDSFPIDFFLRTVELMDPATRTLGISGGEPLLLGEDLFGLIRKCRECLPATELQILSNGRLFFYREFARRIAEIGHQSLLFGIPLYADNPIIHDDVVQAQGAFGQTVCGIQHLGLFRIPVEIRMVLTKKTVSRLPAFSEFVVQNFPFVSHVAFMGLEMMGHANPNRLEVWIDPLDFQTELAESLRILSLAGMKASIYNLPLCVLPKSLWEFSRQSISDWKNVYLEECTGCLVKERCGGLFVSGQKIKSRGIRPLMDLA